MYFTLANLLSTIFLILDRISLSSKLSIDFILDAALVRILQSSTTHRDGLKLHLQSRQFVGLNQTAGEVSTL